MRRLFCCLLLLPVLALSAAPVNLYAEQNPIVVGGNSNYPPYEFLDEQGNPAGYNVDLTKAIANVMGLKVKFRLDDWVNVRKALDASDVDALQGISYSEGRADVVDFSIPHAIVHHSIFARKGFPVVRTLEELDGKMVAIHERGFIYDYIIEKGIKMHVVPTGTPADALRVVASGKADYAVVASLPAAYIIKKYALTNVVAVTTSIISVKYGYGVKKGNTELLAKFNEGLAILKQTGQHKKIYDKWLGVIEPFGIAQSLVVKYGAIIGIVFLFTLGGTLLWSTTLRNQVAARTSALEREVQERKRAAEELRLRQQQLVQADKMASLGILVSGVAHEINNPNALILLNAPLLADYLKDTQRIIDEYYHEHGDFETAGIPYSRMRSKVLPKLLEIQEGAKKIKRIVEDLKGFARREESDNLILLDFNSVVQAAVRLVETTIRKSTDHFKSTYASDLPEIKGNSQRLEQVVVNLVLNACQSLRNCNESIAISTRYDENAKNVVLEVCDEGEGISADDLSHLTDPFFTTKRERGGTGLGLSVSDGIIKEHRGSLEFKSIVGKGTSVTLKLRAAGKESI